MNLKLARTYPTDHTLGEVELTIRPMSSGDRDGVLAFARALPEHDLLFLRRDITQPEAVDQWLGQVASGEVQTLLALSGDRVVGYGTLHAERLRWSSHVAEIRVLVAEELRGKGLGTLLTQEVFATALANNIEKMVARMTLDQRGAISTFEGLGFKAEALLRDQVKDRNGRSHDLLVMSHRVADFQSTLDSYGITDALA